MPTVILPPLTLLQDTTAYTSLKLGSEYDSNDTSIDYKRLRLIRKRAGTLKNILSNPLYVSSNPKMVEVLRPPHLTACVREKYMHYGLVGTVYQHALGTEGTLEVDYVVRARERFRGIKRRKGKTEKRRARNASDFEAELYEFLNNGRARPALMPPMAEIPPSIQTFIRRKSKRDGCNVVECIRGMGMVPLHEHRWIEGMVKVAELLEEKEEGFTSKEKALLYKFGGKTACLERLGLIPSGYGPFPKAVTSAKEVYMEALRRFDNQTAPVTEPRIAMGDIGQGMEGWERESLGRRLGLEWES